MRTDLLLRAGTAAALVALAACAKPEPPIRAAYVPEAPCVRYARGTCEARIPTVRRPPPWYSYERLLPE